MIEHHLHFTLDDVENLVVLGVGVRRNAEVRAAELGDGERLPRVAPIFFHEDGDRTEREGLTLVVGERTNGTLGRCPAARVDGRQELRDVFEPKLKGTLAELAASFEADRAEK